LATLIYLKPLGFASGFDSLPCNNLYRRESQWGVRRRTGRVSRGKNGKMVLRWAASAFLSAKKNFRRIMGYKDLWTLEAILGLYYFHNLLKVIGESVSLQMKQEHKINIPITAGMWGGSYMVANDDGQAKTNVVFVLCHW